MAEKKYVLTNRRSGKALTATGTGAVQMTADGSDAQIWCAKTAGGASQLVNKANGLALTVPGTAENGAALILAEPSASPAQEFKLAVASKGFKKLVHAASGRVIDVAGISDEDGAAVQLWDFVKGENQEWVAVEVEKPKSAPVKRAVKEVKAEKPVAKAAAAKAEKPAAKAASKAEKPAAKKPAAKKTK